MMRVRMGAAVAACAIQTAEANSIKLVRCMLRLSTDCIPVRRWGAGNFLQPVVSIGLQG